MRQVRGISAGLELYENELRHTEWDEVRLEAIVTRRRGLLATRLGLAGASELGSVPPTCKQDLRARPQGAISGLVDPVDYLTVRTSGTTGVPTVVHHSDDYLVERAAQRLRMYAAYGIKRHPRVLQVSAKPWRPLVSFVGGLTAGAGTVIALNVAEVTDSNSDYVRRLLRDFDAELLSGQSMELLAFAEAVDGRLLDVPAAAHALSQGDTLLTGTRSSIEATLDVHLHDTYGLQEVGQVAFECPTNQGAYHLNAEAVDAHVDAASQIAVTSLINRAMSIVGYETGDRARTLERCPCGRALPVIRDLEGRARPLIRARNGRGRQATRLQSMVSAVHGEVWQLVQRPCGRVLLRVPVRATGASERQLRHDLDETYDIDVEIDYARRDELLGPNGKLRRYVEATQ